MLILRGGGLCLKNPPAPSDVVDIAVCGNGRLDNGEQCDCGKPEVESCLPDKLTHRKLQIIVLDKYVSKGYFTVM